MTYERKTEVFLMLLATLMDVAERQEEWDELDELVALWKFAKENDNDGWIALTEQQLEKVYA